MPPPEPADHPDITVASCDDILDRVAQDIIRQYSERLPDLADLRILLPDASLAGLFRERLLDHLPSGTSAVLPPWTGTLAQWINGHVPLKHSTMPVISGQARRLLFIEALREQPGLFRDDNKWQVTDALLMLFDELVLNDSSLLDESPANWRDRVRQAYACEIDIDQLDREAAIVHTLWKAWRRQLDANGIIDEAGAYALRLREAHRFIADTEFFYAVHLENATLLEQAFVDRIRAQRICRRAMFDMQQASQAGSRETMRRFTAASLAQDGPGLRERAEDFRAQQKVTALPLLLHFCGDAEQEARAVDLQIRRWLLAGKTRIGIVSEDRKLSRRVRALLERANVNLRDLAGWSLATTSAASVIERWLECIEEDFDYRPMLDVLKSPAFRPDGDREDHLLDVYRLEHDIIQQENIAHGIARYRRQLKDRSNRLHHWPRESYRQVHALLDRLESAAHYLLQFHRSRYPVPAEDCMQALLDSLEKLGLIEGLGQDAAGHQILDALREMQQGLETAAPPLTWQDFRTWVGMTLEESLFNPADEPSPVWLMSLAQADGHRFDALVLAAVDREHLPGKPASSPFFNQQVRRSLKLPDWNRQKRFRLQQFQRVLQSSPEVLVTCKHEENGEAVPLSPWVEALDVFYRLTHDSGTLDHPELPALLAMDTDVFLCDTDALPARPEQPAPAMRAQLVPKKISAGSHQRLIDCPYRFFAGDALKLRAPEAIIEELQKSDYGHRVHAILQAFHTSAPGMPAPFTGAITTASRERAIAHLEELSRQVFRQDLEDNSLHRSWLFRWQQRIPEYIDWQITQQDWSPMESELSCETEIAHGIRLKGILDRIDAGNGTRRIIDYKTGNAPAQDEVDSGEDVQLVTYSMLHTEATGVAYLQLDPSGRKVSIRSQLEDDALRDLRQAAKERLVTLLGMQIEGSPMPAWGDSATCRYCEYIGLCRRKVWDDTRD